jgi:hypothetical protein
MKNVADVKTAFDARTTVIIAYVQKAGFIRRFMPGKTEILIKKHRHAAR